MRQLYERASDGPWTSVGDGLEYRLETEDGHGYLFFQFTTTDKDWKYNFDFPAVPYRRMPRKWYAHRGLVTLYKSGRDEIMAAIVASGVKSLVIAGISQGAALACLAHEDVVFNAAVPDVKTFAFAGPRVFWFPGRELRRRLKGVTHVTRRGDIVTMVPPWLWGYVHCYRRIRIGKAAFPWWTHHRFEEYLESF